VRVVKLPGPYTLLPIITPSITPPVMFTSPRGTEPPDKEFVILSSIGLLIRADISAEPLSGFPKELTLISKI
jgi:hypothetical protein